MAVSSVLDPSRAVSETMSQIAKKDPNTQVSKNLANIASGAISAYSGYKLGKGLANAYSNYQTKNATIQNNGNYTSMFDTPTNNTGSTIDLGATSPNYMNMPANAGSQSTLNSSSYSDISDQAASTSANNANNATNATNGANDSGFGSAKLGAGLAILGTALNAWDTVQQQKAFDESVREMNKQLSFAVQNTNNQVTTTNNRINSAVNIRSAMQNKTKEQASAALQNAKEKNVKKLDNMSI